MKRRNFIAGLAGAAAWPVAALAQQAERMYRIGVLAPSSASASYAENLAGLRRGLRELGYIEDKNFILELRWADGDIDRLSQLAIELVASKVDVIVSSSAIATHAAARATGSISIVQASGADPVRSGIADGLSRPGSNVTGVTNQSEDLSAKLLELLLTMIPKASRVGVLFVPGAPVTAAQLSQIQGAARAIPIVTAPVEVVQLAALDTAFSRLGQAKLAGLVVLSSALFSAHSRSLVEFVGKAGLPAIYPYRHFVLDGGLMAYGTNLVDQWRQSARFVDRILKGSRAEHLPIEQPTRFEFVINLKTAKTLGLEVPPTLLARADEVIE